MLPFKKSNLATIAIATGLVIASGTGGAVAGALITGKQIKDGTVTSVDIANGSLTGTDLKDGTVGGVDLKDGTVGGADLKDGGVGLPDLAPAARGLRNLAMTQDNLVVATAGNAAQISLDCPAGKILVSAAGYWEQSSRAVQVVFHASSASAYSDGSDVPNDTLNIQLMCANQG